MLPLNKCLFYCTLKPHNKVLLPNPGSMKRVKRGNYQIKFLEITDKPRETKPGEITEKFIKLAEDDINADPASYLWSHDRWKHKKPTVSN